MVGVVWVFLTGKCVIVSMASVEDFLSDPSEEGLERCTRDQLLIILIWRSVIGGLRTVSKLSSRLT